MSLIRCPECGKEISSTAASCPGCGFTMSIENGTTKSDQIMDMIEVTNKHLNTIQTILYIFLLFMIVGIFLGYIALSQFSNLIIPQ